MFGHREEQPVYEGHADLSLPRLHLDTSKNIYDDQNIF